MLPPVKIDKSLADAMRKMQKQQAKQEETPVVPLRPVDPKLPFCCIIDIDKTLATRSPQRGIFEFEKADQDKVILATQHLIQALWRHDAESVESYEHDATIFLWTGREEKFREITDLWLTKYGIFYDTLLMRPTGERKEAKILKEDFYVNSIAHKFNVLLILDDDPRVVNHMKTLGLFCLTIG